MKLPHEFHIIIAIVMLAWASIFITVLNQDSRLRSIENQNKVITSNSSALLDQLKNDFNNQSAQSNQQLLTLQADMQCIAQFFAQVNRINLTLNNLKSCTINRTGSPSNAVEGSKSTNGNNNRSTPAAAKSAPAQNPSPSPKPKPKPGLIKQLLNML